MLSYLSILEVLNQRKSAIIKQLEENQKDKRRKDNSDSLFARIEECDKILSLIKDRIIDESDKPETFIGNLHTGLLQHRSQPTTKEALVIPHQGKKADHVFDIGGDLPHNDLGEILQ